MHMHKHLGTNRVNSTCVLWPLRHRPSWSARACTRSHETRKTHGRVCPLCYLLLPVMALPLEALIHTYGTRNLYSSGEEDGSSATSASAHVEAACSTAASAASTTLDGCFSLVVVGVLVVLPL